MNRVHELRAGGIEKILILDRGNLELGVPRGWTVEPDPEGFMKVKDPTDSCLVEVSYLRLPGPVPGLPPLTERLQDTPEVTEYTAIAAFERAGLHFAWAEYAFHSDDTKGGPRRPACGRWLLAANDTFQAFLTCYYWVDDAKWAVPIWEKVVDTLRLGSGIPLESPKDHWSLREQG